MKSKPTWSNASRAFHHVGFFSFFGVQDATTRDDSMDATIPMASKVAQAALDFQQQAMSHVPALVNVVLSGETLVITLCGALSPAEKALAKCPGGSARIQEFHRLLFASSADSLKREIQRITGVEVQEATAQVEPASGTMVQVFVLAQILPVSTWNGSGTGVQA